MRLHINPEANRALAGVALIVAASVLLGPVSAQDNEAAKRAAKARPAVAPPAPLVRLAGEVLAIRDAHVAAEVSGRVVARPDTDGGFVKEGDAIVVLDDRAIVAAERRARAAARSAHARREWARRELGRVTALMEKGSIGKSDLDRAEVALLEAEANADAAKAAHEEVLVQRERTRIRAPFAGELVRVYAALGSYLRVSEPAYRIVDRTALKIVAYVPAHVVSSLKTGRQIGVTATFEQDAAQRPAKLVSIAAASTGTSRTFRIELRLRDKSEKLRPGMAAWLHFDPPLR